MQTENELTSSTTWVELLTWLGEAKWRIASFALAVGVVTAATTFALPPIYTARTTLLPPPSQQSGGTTAAMAALGGFAGAIGAVKTPDELYITLLRSDSVVRPLVERFGLRERYGVEAFETIRNVVLGHVRITSEKKTGVISIEVDDTDPAFAAKLANAHPDELAHLLSRLAVSEAQQRRLFFSKQLDEANEALLKAEQDLKRSQQSSGLLVPDKQAEALLVGAAQLKAQIAEREVRLKVLRTTATDQNPEAIRLISELQGMKAELRRLESGNTADTNSGSSPLDLAVRALPDAASKYIRHLREVKYREAVLQSMLRQFEAAKLDEAKEGSVAQQIDVALPPDRKSKPARALITLAATLLAFVAACLWTLARRYALLPNDDPASVTAWRALRKAWNLAK